MSVTLIRPYQTFAAGTTVTLPDSTEAALIAQGIAAAAGATTMTSIYGAQDVPLSQGGNNVFASQAGISTPTLYQGPLNWPCIALGSAALTGYETNGVAQVAGSINLTEIFVPFWQTWTGIGVLNGTTVGTSLGIVALYGTNGALLANSALAGSVTANASVFQNRAFTSPITLAPGRYFLGVQYNNTTDTVRHLLAANGSNVCTSVTAGVFGTIPATMTVPSTFTTAVGCITQLYV